MAHMERALTNDEVKFKVTSANLLAGSSNTVTPRLPMAPAPAPEPVPTPPPPEEVLAAAKAAQAALDEKRARAIAAKEAAHRGVQMRYVTTVPGGFYTSACREKAAVPPRTAEEIAHLAEVDARRTFNVGLIEFRRRAAELFRRTDTDGSGALSRAELVGIRESEQMAEFMLEATDSDKSGTLSLAEFLSSLEDTYAKSTAGAARILQVYEQRLQQAAVH